jgi:hypothetical protein
MSNPTQYEVDTALEMLERMERERPGICEKVAEDNTKPLTLLRGVAYGFLFETVILIAVWLVWRIL